MTHHTSGNAEAKDPTGRTSHPASESGANASPALPVTRVRRLTQSGAHLQIDEWSHTMSLDSMKTLFTNELKDVLNAERQLVQALPKMARAAESQELQNAFTDHLKETEGHVTRLEKIFGLIGETARGKKCKGMEGLLEEGKEIMEEGEKEASSMRPSSPRPSGSSTTRSPPTGACGATRTCSGWRRRWPSWTRRCRKRKPPTRSCPASPRVASTSPRSRSARVPRGRAPQTAVLMPA